MPALIPDSITDTARSAAHTRMSGIFDRAAERNGVSPEDFRAAIREAMQYADSRMQNRCTGDISPEAFVLSLIGQLF